MTEWKGTHDELELEQNRVLCELEPRQDGQIRFRSRREVVGALRCFGRSLVDGGGGEGVVHVAQVGLRG